MNELINILNSYPEWRELALLGGEQWWDMSSLIPTIHLRVQGIEAIIHISETDSDWDTASQIIIGARLLLERLPSPRVARRYQHVEWQRALNEMQVQLSSDDVVWTAPATVSNETPESRSFRFLIDHLTEAQAKELKAVGLITVKGQSEDIYRISAGRVMNVLRMRDYRSFCVQPAADLPLWDQVLMQVLMLQYDEQGFLRVANQSRTMFEQSADLAREYNNMVARIGRVMSDAAGNLGEIIASSLGNGL